MRVTIINKLEKELLKSIEFESQIVYIFVEIRKIINEYDSTAQNYPTLTFFSDWVLHTKLDRIGAKRMLDSIRDYYGGLDPLVGMRKTTTFTPFLYFIFLRLQLKNFLENNNLPIKLVENRDRWDKFLLLLINIIADSPLISETGYTTELKFYPTDSLDNVTCKLKDKYNEIQTNKSTNRLDLIGLDFK